MWAPHDKLNADAVPIINALSSDKSSTSPNDDTLRGSEMHEMHAFSSNADEEDLSRENPDLISYRNPSSSHESESTVLHFNDLAFANDLHNPCSPGHNHKLLVSEDDTDPHMSDSNNNRLALGLLRELVTKSTFLQGLITNIIRMVFCKAVKKFFS